jgi:hypothetical protein
VMLRIIACRATDHTEMDVLLPLLSLRSWLHVMVDTVQCISCRPTWIASGSAWQYCCERGQRWMPVLDAA